MKHGWLVLGLMCAFLSTSGYAQEIPTENTGDEQIEEVSEELADIQDETALLDSVYDTESPDSSTDYEEVYQMRTLERTLLPDENHGEELVGATILPGNAMELSHDAAIHLLLEHSGESGQQRGFQRQNSKLMAASIAQVKQQLSAPGTSIEQPFGMDCTSQPTVQEYIAIFTAPGSKTMKAWIKRMGKYQAVLEKVLIQEDVPTDLIYLAMIESGFKPRVKSPASAAGMWQFMAGTAKDMGLKINEYVDERYDPIKSAHAAAQYLKKQYARYNSWPLAMAAYNGGAGTVNIAIDRYNTNDYFKLVKYGAMYDETRRYVPRILAAAIIGKNLKAFGFDGLTAEDPFVFDEVEVPGNTKLAVLAQASNCSVEVLKELNPELLKEVTPPGNTYTLRIPLDHHSTFVENFDKISKKYADASETMTLMFGETLEILGDDIGVPARVLRNLNHLKSKETVPYGTEIIVPDGSKRGHKTHNNKESSELPVILVSPEKFTYRDRTRVFYETQSGDTIKDIATAFHQLPNQIAIWNELDLWAKLRPKMMLQIYVSNTDELENIRYIPESEAHIVIRGSEEHQEIIEARKRAANKSSGKSSTTSSSNSKYVMHTVTKGDTLSQIAHKYGVSLKSILDLNKLTEQTPIHKGQQLKIKKK